MPARAAARSAEPNARSRRGPSASRAIRQYSRRAAGGRHRDSRAKDAPRGAGIDDGFASSAGMARPMPTDAPVGEISAELTPMTLPFRSNIGPPLLPMLMDASVWDVAVVGTGAGDPAMQGRDDAGGDRAAETIGVADGEDQSPTRRGCCRPSSQTGGSGLRSSAARDRSAVAPDDARRIFAAVGQVTVTWSTVPLPDALWISDCS